MHTDKFDILDQKNGIYKCVAKANYNTATLSINPSMSYKEYVDSTTSVTIPVEITHGDKIVSLSPTINITPAPKPTYEESHPQLNYVCFGKDSTDPSKVNWGIYINYNKAPLKNLKINASFSGSQQIVKDSILAYKVADNEITDDKGYILDAVNHNYEHYDYDGSVFLQNAVNDGDHKLTVNQSGPFTISGHDYSRQPMYVWFQTKIPTGTDIASPTSKIELGADGIRVEKEAKPQDKSGNSADSSASEKTYSWKIQYQDENGNPIAEMVTDPDRYASGTSYDGTAKGYAKSTITTDGKKYDLVPAKSTNTSGKFTDSDVVTTYVYKLHQSDQSTDPDKPTTPADPSNPGEPTTPTEPSNPAEPTTPTEPSNHPVAA